MSQLTDETHGATAEPGGLTAEHDSTPDTAYDTWVTPAYTVVDTALEVTAYARADR
ncbi:pyrroloquinoline quinone precursor peptide PqqA [Streptomyces sp. NPDC002851]